MKLSALVALTRRWSSPRTACPLRCSWAPTISSTGVPLTTTIRRDGLPAALDFGV